MARKEKAVADKKPKKKETPLEFTASIAVILVIGLFIITFNLQAFEIPSSSMENTLLIGDHVFVNRITYAPPTRWLGPLVPYRDVKRGDIVVFLSPAQAGLYVVKRIVGLPGDRLRLQDGVLYRNGERQDEPYVIRSVRDNNPYRDNFPSIPPSLSVSVTPQWERALGAHLEGGELVVPEGSYFAMGDNRDVSLDSRYWGFIPRENIIGRPWFIYWSFQTPPGQHTKTSIGERVAFIFRIVLHFFDQTRWNRMLKPVH